MRLTNPTPTATLIISPDAASRIARARAWLEARAPAEEVVIVGATLDAPNELARTVARRKGAVFGYHRLTWGQFAASLARLSLAAVNVVPIGQLGIEAVANRAIKRISDSGGLGRYADLASSPGFARALAGVITELRLEQAGPDAVARVAPDLCSFFRAFQEELVHNGFTDWPGVLQSAAVVSADTQLSHPLIGYPSLLLDVPVTTAADVSLLRALCSRCPEMLVTAPAHDAITIAHLKSALAPEVVDLSAAASVEKRGSLSHLQCHLFNDSSPESLDQLDDQVVIFSAPGESRECVEIARRVLKLARDGVAFDRVAVLLRSPEEYRSHLEEAFARADVPVHFMRGTVRPDPAGRAFHALLRCAAENLSARRFAEYLSLGACPDCRSGWR
jgi:hypothetical protein